MKVHIISFTQAGFSLSKQIDSDSSTFGKGKKVSEWTKTHFQKGNCLIFIGAAGIAVRSIAPFLENKKNDPAVLVIDEKGRFVIPILSGHIGGANEMAVKIAEKLGAQAVLTTASDVNGLPAIDVFASKNGLEINDMTLAKEFASSFLNYHELMRQGILNSSTIPVVSSFSDVPKVTLPFFSISPYIKKDTLNLIPRCVILGIGCKKGKSPEELKDFVLKNLESRKIDVRSVLKIASIDLKKEEKALVSLAQSLNVPFVTFSAVALNRIKQKVSHSDFVSSVTGTDNVCERSAFAAGSDSLIASKISSDGMTLAIGMKKEKIEIPEEFKGCLI